VIADVVRADLTPARRREVHRAIALGLEELGVPGRAGEVARHAEAGDEPALACRAALQAADDAARLGAPDDVVPWLDLAGRVAPDAAAADEVRRVSVRLLGDRAPAPPRPHRHTAPRGAGLSRRDLDLDAARTDGAKLRDR